MDRQRLIVVSNRQPYEHRWESNQLVCTRTDGGLTAALDPVLRRHGGTWVAWGRGQPIRTSWDRICASRCLQSYRPIGYIASG